MKNHLEYKNNLSKVSIVTVVFNDVSHIENTILSVISQSYQSIEYIVIDGGSSDGTVDIIRKYDSKISKWISESDKGIYDAMNKAINMATGEWIIFMNSGDSFFNNNVVEDVFCRKYSDNVGVIWGDTNLYKDGEYYMKFESKPFYKHILMSFRGKGICHQSMFTRVSLAQKLMFDLNYKISADFDMAYKIYKEKYKFEYVPFIIANFDISGMSSNKENRNICLKENGSIVHGWYNPFYYLYLIYVRLKK